MWFWLQQAWLEIVLSSPLKYPDNITIVKTLCSVMNLDVVSGYLEWLFVQTLLSGNCCQGSVQGPRMFSL